MTNEISTVSLFGLLYHTRECQQTPRLGDLQLLSLLNGYDKSGWSINNDGVRSITLDISSCLISTSINYDGSSTSIKLDHINREQYWYQARTRPT